MNPRTDEHRSPPSDRRQRHRGLWPRLLLLALASAALFGLLKAPLFAQPPGEIDVYHPLNQYAPPGMAAEWALRRAESSTTYLQPMRVSLPSTGRVVVYAHRPARPTELAAPAQFGVAVGGLYRLRIGEMPEFPGIELYPTVEVLDRLHPPPGRAADFPVPIEFTFDEIQQALEDRLVTKVVYLEQPQLATPTDLQQPLAALTLAPGRNLLAEADRLGRPMAIIRLGGRLPDPTGRDAGFYGNGAPISADAPATQDLSNVPPPRALLPRSATPTELLNP